VAFPTLKLQQSLLAHSQQMLSTVENLLARAQHRLDYAVRGLQSPAGWLQQQQVRLVSMSQNLNMLFQQQLGVQRHRYQIQQQKLTQKLLDKQRMLLTAQRQRVQTQVGRLALLSPMAVLERGYAIVYGDQGILKHTVEVLQNETLELQLVDGRVKVKTL
jgi:exodeoxyribonuclease VII large subunit